MIRDWVFRSIERKGRKRRPIPLKFGELDVINRFNIYVGGRWEILGDFGYYVDVPNETVAFINVPNEKEPLAIENSGMVKLPAGRYTLNYVDLHQRRSVLNNITAKTRDGWRVILNIIVHWKVADPRAVLRIEDIEYRAVPALQDESIAAAKNHIRSQAYANLIGLSDRAPIDNKFIEDDILHRLQDNLALRAFEISKVSLEDRKGDPQLDDIESSTQVQKITNLRDAQVQLEKLNQEIKAKEQELEIVAKDAEVEMAKRETDLSLTEVNEKIAEIKNRIARTQIELDQFRDQPQLNLEYARLKLEGLEELTSLVLSALSSPGQRRNIDENLVIGLLKFSEYISSAPSGRSPNELPSPKDMNTPKEPPEILEQPPRRETRDFFDIGDND